MQNVGVSSLPTLLPIAVAKLVRPVKQLVFYIDSLMPVKWNPYIKAGAESWNKAFEKIGFKDVICVKEFPKNDTLFNANSF